MKKTHTVVAIKNFRLAKFCINIIHIKWLLSDNSFCIKLTSPFLSDDRKCSATCTGRILASNFLLYACKCCMSSFSSVNVKKRNVRTD